MKKKNSTAVVAAKVPRGESSDMTTALTVHLDAIVFPEGVETLGEKANFLHGYSVEASKRANGAAILAGWVLSVARETCAHGQWMAWLRQNVTFGKSTATNYMNLYAQTLGKARANARRPIALEVEPTVEELEAAAHDVDGTALSALYKSTRIIATPEGWGGKRDGAGAKKKDENAEVSAALDEVANSPALLIAAIREPISTVYKAWRERDVFAKIDMSDLALVTASLQELATAATAALKARSKK
ncbi:MAG: DUF3102 domain-containing protein [Kiritimatiellae bacterium]|nr:DUF3102 domain-containing protein [Kiritimatiellia bacterium]